MTSHVHPKCTVTAYSPRTDVKRGGGGTIRMIMFEVNHCYSVGGIVYVFGTFLHARQFSDKTEGGSRQ